MIIGLNGFKGSGKDTVGSYLVDNYDFTQMSFAAKLKESAAALFNIEPAKWEKWKNDETMRVMLYKAEEFEPWVVESDGDPNHYVNTISVRQFLQRYGTESHRDIFGTDFWVDHALEGVDADENIVFTDARFENELSRIKSLGGYNVQIIRPNIDDKDSHASEARPPANLIDYVIDNDGGLDHLYLQSDWFIAYLDSQFKTPAGGTYGDWRDNPGNYGE